MRTIEERERDREIFFIFFKKKKDLPGLTKVVIESKSLRKAISYITTTLPKKRDTAKQLFISPNTIEYTPPYTSFIHTFNINNTPKLPIQRHPQSKLLFGQLSNYLHNLGDWVLL